MSVGRAEEPRTITVDSMVKILFTGDSQSCGRNLAIDFPQLISRLVPARVINTAVGGSNSDALLKPMTGGRVRIKKGENVLYGENVHWGMGPYPGVKVTVNGETYTMDHVVEHPKLVSELHLCEPARADYAGTDCAVEPCWEVRVARYKPDVVVLMYINDGEMPAAKQANWREMIRRIREMGAVPVLMRPVPVDDSAHGGNHPGTNQRYAKNAETVREIARQERCWFVDVFHLYQALDPPFRMVIHDGCHPDTDGQTCIVNGLMWVFKQMGLLDARPFIKGWALTAPPGPLPEMLKSGVRPFRTSQPDHPDPDHQSEAGFTLEAIRRNDEYGLIAAKDGAGVPVGQGLLFRCGVSRDFNGGPVTLRLAETGGCAVQVWLPPEARWLSLPPQIKDGWACANIPANAIENGVFHLLLTGNSGAMLDAVALGAADAAPAKDFKTSAGDMEYVLESDDALSDNALLNSDLLRGERERAERWTLSGAARVNRPFREALDRVSFADAKDLRVMEFAPSAPARPGDVIEVSGSAKGNDGPYRILDAAGNGRWLSRKRAKSAESGLRGVLLHNDGCGLVPGDCGIEVSGDGVASQRASLPDGALDLRASFFYRVYDPKSIGTRDAPESCAQAKITFFDCDGRPVGTPWTISDLPCSYQWQKAEAEHAVPDRAMAFELSVKSASAKPVQYTGLFIGPIRGAQ